MLVDGGAAPPAVWQPAVCARVLNPEDPAACHGLALSTALSAGEETFMVIDSMPQVSAVVCCAVLCCGVLCCAVLCRAVPCGAVLCDVPFRFWALKEAFVKAIGVGIGFDLQRVSFT